MIEIRDLTVRVGRFAIEGINLKVPTGKYAILMGRTGCGKTTLLETVCGLRRHAAGTIRLMNCEVSQLKAAQRGVGYVPQDTCLFQTMTVRDNLAFALHIRKWPRRKINARVEELAELLGVNHLLNRHPHGLSGGESQRVALGRALAFRPDVLCLDEPLSALDSETREEMYQLLKSIQKHTGVSTLHVTHNQEEAAHLGDCWFCYNGGRIDNLQEAGKVHRMSVE
jgi:molybdate/tungstate transport system ATP-binding protein